MPVCPRRTTKTRIFLHNHSVQQTLLSWTRRAWGLKLSIAVAFQIPGWEGLQLQSVETMLKLTDGITGSQLVCELTRRGTMVPAAGKNQTPVIPPAKLPISVIQALAGVIIVTPCFLNVLVWDLSSFGFCDMAFPFISVSGNALSWWWTVRIPSGGN